MSSRAPAVAIAAATVSVLISLIAVGVVASRNGAKERGSTADGEGLTLEAKVAATDIIQLKRDSVETAPGGVRMRDKTLGAALGLQTMDVVTAIGGHTVRKERDVTEAILAASMFETAMIDVDIVREDKPLLLRWKVDGDLRSAHRDESVRRSVQ